MCNFVLGDKANRALSPKTKFQTLFQIQKYDGLENIEQRNRAVEVTQLPGNSAVQVPTQIYVIITLKFLKKKYGGNIFELHFLGKHK